MQLGIKHDTAETNPTNGIRRAVCGKTARTVRRGGDRFHPGALLYLSEERHVPIEKSGGGKQPCTPPMKSE